MSFEHWLSEIKTAEKQSLIKNQVRKIFYKFSNGRKMMEDYNMETGVLQFRAWQKSGNIMGEPILDIEVGESPRIPLGGGSTNKRNADNDDAQSEFVVRESNVQPTLSMRMTKKNMEWRVRNLPYPIDVYVVTVIPERHAIEVRTTNKKYYKIIMVHDLKRCNTPTEQSRLSVHHQYNTLIITYKKPDILCELERQVLLELQNVTTEMDIDDILQNCFNDH